MYNMYITCSLKAEHLIMYVGNSFYVILNEKNGILKVKYYYNENTYSKWLWS